MTEAMKAIMLGSWWKVKRTGSARQSGSDQLGGQIASNEASLLSYEKMNMSHLQYELKVYFWLALVSLWGPGWPPVHSGPFASGY